MLKPFIYFILDELIHEIMYYSQLLKLKKFTLPIFAAQIKWNREGMLYSGITDNYFVQAVQFWKENTVFVCFPIHYCLHCNTWLLSPGIKKVLF